MLLRIIPASVRRNPAYGRLPVYQVPGQMREECVALPDGGYSVVRSWDVQTVRAIGVEQPEFLYDREDPALHCEYCGYVGLSSQFVSEWQDSVDDDGYYVSFELQRCCPSCGGSDAVPETTDEQLSPERLRAYADANEAADKG